MSSTKQDSYIAIVDCNNFYASCERVFNPALNNKPVIVLSNNDGCVIARSQEVKDLGIPMGIPLGFPWEFPWEFTWEFPREFLREFPWEIAWEFTWELP